MIYLSLISVEGQNGKIWKCDTIKHKGEFWLVPEWLSSPYISTRSPERIIRVAAFEHQVQIGSQFGDVIVTYPIPKQYFDSKKDIGGDMIRAPQIEFLKPSS